jgi:hypothetical protein
MTADKNAPREDRLSQIRILHNLTTVNASEIIPLGRLR